MRYCIELLCFTICLEILTSNGVHGQNGCRTLNFNISSANKRLANHNVRTIKPITDIGSCRRKCFMEPLCSSINFCVKPGEDSWCELVDTDQTRHATDMQNKTGCTHLSTESVCVSNPCVANATCSGDYLKDHDQVAYKCICPHGYEGLYCNKDVDECSTGKHDCHVNATCSKTNGGYSCTCKEGFHGNGSICEGPVQDCAALQSAGFASSGVYKVDPDHKGFIDVYCDMISEGGGWTVISNRFDSSVNFNRNWTQYKRGFGDIQNGEFWLGNDNIHRLTAARPRTQLYVPLVNMAGSNFYAKYSTFAVASESDLYRLTVSGYYDGNAGDSFAHNDATWRSHNMVFSTPERDNDRCSCNCAAKNACGWWMNWCAAARMTQYPIWWYSLSPSYQMREGSMNIKPYN